MNDQDFLNSIYDLLAQNEVEQWQRDQLTQMVDHVDTERNMIVFIGRRGKVFELKLVDVYAPSGMEQE